MMKNGSNRFRLVFGQCLALALMASASVTAQAAIDVTGGESESKETVSLKSNSTSVSHLGLEATGSSASGLGNRSFQMDGSKKNYSSTPVTLSAEFLPLPTQKFGVVGVGALFKTNSGQIANGWAYGAQIRYQAKYFENQPVVPVLGYTAERWNYLNRDLGNSRGLLSAFGPTAGLWLNLNSLDESRGNSLYSQTGIRRTYLVTEYRKVQGTRGSTSLRGENFNVGFRFEL